MWRFLLVAVCFGALSAETFPELSKQAASARESNHVDQAIRLYRECVRLKPAWAEGWWYLGTMLYDQGTFTGARDALTKFVKLEPKAAPGWALLGLSDYEKKNYADSLRELESGLALGLKGDPAMSKVTRYHSALLLTYFGQFEPALLRFTQLAVQGGDDPDMITAVGLAALRMPMLPSELPAEDRDLVQDAGRAVYDSMARRSAEAKREFEALVAKYPRTPQVHNVYAVFLLSSDPDQAIREWRRELEISPKHIPARLQLAFEYLKRGEADQAAPLAREAAELEPDSFVAHNALGRVLIETGDIRRGVAELEKARDLEPASAETRVALASAYAKAGRSQDAARERAEFSRLRKQQEAAQ